MHERDCDPTCAREAFDVSLRTALLKRLPASHPDSNAVCQTRAHAARFFVACGASVQPDDTDLLGQMCEKGQYELLWALADVLPADPAARRRLPNTLFGIGEKRNMLFVLVAPDSTLGLSTPLALVRVLAAAGARVPATALAQLMHAYLCFQVRTDALHALLEVVRDSDESLLATPSTDVEAAVDPSDEDLG
jgi:hypothetical protein